MAADENGEEEGAPAEDAQAAGDAGEAGGPRPLMHAEHARRTIQDQAEDARRRILGPRGRTQLPPPPPREEIVVPEGFDEDTADVFRRLVEGLEDETRRLEEQAANLRLEVEKAASTLRREVDRAAEVLVVRDAEDAQKEEVNVQDVDRLAEAIERASELGVTHFRELTEVATSSADAVKTRLAGMQAGVEHVEASLGALDAEVTRIAGAIERLHLPERPTDEPGGRIANFGGDLLKALELVAEQLSAFSQRVEQLPDRIAERLGPPPTKDDDTAEALSRLAEEVKRLGRRAPARRTLAQSTGKRTRKATTAASGKDDDAVQDEKPEETPTED